MSHIFHKIFATGLPVVKTLIKFHSNCSKENEEEERIPINIELTEQKAGPEMMKMLLNLDDRMYNKKTGKILLWLTSLKITKAS